MGVSIKPWAFITNAKIDLNISTFCLNAKIARSFEFSFNFTRLSLKIWTYMCATNTLEGNHRCEKFN